MDQYKFVYGQFLYGRNVCDQFLYGHFLQLPNLEGHFLYGKKLNGSKFILCIMEAYCTLYSHSILCQTVCGGAMSNLSSCGTLILNQSWSRRSQSRSRYGSGSDGSCVPSSDCTHSILDILL
jgi:hypothetical protein